MFLSFADSKVPEFKEARTKDIYNYGERNDYPEYLTYLYDKSPKHGAIINGKCNYIFGNGLEKRTPVPNSFASFTTENDLVIPGKVINRDGETMDDILQKSIKDIELYGGFYWAITYNQLGRIAEIFHREFSCWRASVEEDGYWYKDDWKKRGDGVLYPTFNPSNPTSTQVYVYREYRPGCSIYPLPGYLPCCNWIETDIEISKFHLSSMKNGLTPSKMIQFFNGEPTEDKKKQIERKFGEKFAGSENAGKFILVFNKKTEEEVRVTDLSATELDKLFDILNKTVQQETLTGHQVTSPMLFGIKTEGQLGGVTELKTAYEIFINTYAKQKQANIIKVVNYFGGLMGLGQDYYLVPVDPVGIVFEAKDFISSLPLEFVFEKLGIPKKFWPAQIAPSVAPAQEGMQADGVNEHLKNLTGRQSQQLQRIIRQYATGKLTLAQATMMLKAGFNFSDEQVKSFLGIEDEFSSQFTEDEVIGLFNQVGEMKEDYHIVSSKKLLYTEDEDIQQDEIEFFKLAFKTEVSTIEASILDLIKKDKRITPDVIAKTIGTTPEYVTAKIATLTKRGLIVSSTEMIGDDIQIERTVTESIKDIEPPNGEIETTEIYIKYSYEGPKDDRNRPFCRKLLDLERLYSRREIETISQRLGYSVWDRRGGWWGDKPYCRHRWVSHVVVKKGGKK